MTNIIEIRTTLPTLEDARVLTHALLDAKLAACCHIGREVDSRFWYGGKQHRDDETPLTIKTRADLFEPVAEKIREIHPYETPVILGYRVDLADDATQNWVADVLAGGRTDE